MKEKKVVNSGSLVLYSLDVQAKLTLNLLRGCITSFILIICHLNIDSNYHTNFLLSFWLDCYLIQWPQLCCRQTAHALTCALEEFFGHY